jgi:hypothetical protein
VVVEGGDGYGRNCDLRVRFLRRSIECEDAKSF